MTIPFGYGEKAELFNPTDYVINPFFAYLTDDGADVTLNENYATATDAYWEARADAVIESFCIAVGDVDISQATAVVNNFGGTTALTNGLKFAVKCPTSGRIVQDITVQNPLRNTSELVLFATTPLIMYSAANSSTSANNELLITAEINCTERFGGGIFVKKGMRFVCTLQDNFTGCDVFLVGVSGHYV